jgi:hypothetical protein
MQRDPTVYTRASALEPDCLTGEGRHYFGERQPRATLSSGLPLFAGGCHVVTASAENGAPNTGVAMQSGLWVGSTAESGLPVWARAAGEPTIRVVTAIIAVVTHRLVLMDDS